MNQWLGLAHSLVVYYGNPIKLRQMQGFYAQFIAPGALCFDIGAHVGNRTWIWSQIGAQVIALEPQPLCMKLLRLFYAQRRGITLIEEAVGTVPGEAKLWISERNPTVTTLSQEWITAVQKAASFATVKWQSSVTVPITTLDQLIATYGEPAFCKIDVEGYELEVLQGLSQPLPALSFEYVPATIDIALACIDRLQELGTYEFNWSVGEQHRWQREQWISAAEMAACLRQLSVDENSGDIYARHILEK